MRIDSSTGSRQSVHSTQTGGRAASRHTRPRRAATAVVALLGTLLVLGLAGPAAADKYDATEAGHPLRIIAYIVHPVGVALDYLLLRPAHWLVSHEPFKTAFGHED